MHGRDVRPCAGRGERRGGGPPLSRLWLRGRHTLLPGLDALQVSLIFGNVTEEDILLRKELDEFAAAHSRFKVGLCVLVGF